jgi:hypothetical protein
MAFISAHFLLGPPFGGKARSCGSLARLSTCRQSTVKIAGVERGIVAHKTDVSCLNDASRVVAK